MATISNLTIASRNNGFTASGMLDGISFNSIGVSDGQGLAKKWNRNDGPWKTSGSTELSAFAVNAVDIDWNGANLNGTIIRTTGELLSWIKNNIGNNSGGDTPITTKIVSKVEWVATPDKVTTNSSNAPSVNDYPSIKITYSDNTTKSVDINESGLKIMPHEQPNLTTANGKLLGDANNDHIVDVGDIAAVIDGIGGSYNSAADVNNDGTVDVADIAQIIDSMAMGDFENYEWYNIPGVYYLYIKYNDNGNILWSPNFLKWTVTDTSQRTIQSIEWTGGSHKAPPSKYMPKFNGNGLKIVYLNEAGKRTEIYKELTDDVEILIYTNYDCTNLYNGTDPWYSVPGHYYCQAKYKNKTTSNVIYFGICYYAAFNLAGGDGNVTTIYDVPGAKITLPSYNGEKDPDNQYNYTFANKWIYNNTYYNVGDEYTLNSNVTFTASWNAISNNPATTTYYWYAGQTQPSSMNNNPTVDDTNFTVNKWHTLTANRIDQTVTGGTVGNTWYVVVPTAKAFKMYDSTFTGEDGGWVKATTTITINGISYDVWSGTNNAKTSVYMQ